MISRKLTIVNKLGLHARAASKFVAEAQKFVSEITVDHGGKNLPYNDAQLDHKLYHEIRNTSFHTMQVSAPSPSSLLLVGSTQVSEGRRTLPPTRAGRAARAARLAGSPRPPGRALAAASPRSNFGQNHFSLRNDRTNDAQISDRTYL